MSDLSTPVDLARLARDIAIEYLNLPAILRAHEISDEDWAKIAVNPVFQNILKEMQASWQAAENTAARVKMKAQTGVEAMIPLVLEEVVKPSVPLIQKIEALKWITKLGELGETQREGGSAEKFVFQINVHPGQPLVKKETAIVDLVPTVIQP